MVGPEQGLTQPGMTIACEIHTSPVLLVPSLLGLGQPGSRLLATQTMVGKLKVRRIEVNGELNSGIYAKA